MSNQKSEQIYKRYRNVAALLLLLWPFSWFSVFLLDDPTVTGMADLIRHYVFYSCIAYPLYFLASGFLGKIALKNDLGMVSIRIIGAIPFLSGLPWFFAFIILGLGFLGVEAKLKEAGWFEPKPAEVFVDQNAIVLAKAAKSGRIDVIEGLCSKTTSVNSAGKGGLTPLFYAKRNIKTFTALLQCGADPNVVLADGDSVMKQAVLSENDDFLKTAVKYGGDPNLKYKAMITNHPIIFLASSISPEKVDLLVSLGANINEKDENGHTLLQHLIVRSKFEMASHILRYAPDLSVKNKRGLSIREITDRTIRGLDKQHEIYKQALKFVDQLEKNK